MLDLYWVLAGLAVGILSVFAFEPVAASMNPGVGRVLTAVVVLGLPLGYTAARFGGSAGRWERSVAAAFGAWLGTVLVPTWLQHRLVVAVPYLWFLPAVAFGGAFACMDCGRSLSSGGGRSEHQRDDGCASVGGAETPRLALKRPGVLLVVAIVAVWCLLPVIRTIGASSHRAHCEQNLKRIFRAIEAYRQRWDGGYPLVLTHRVPTPGSRGIPTTGLYPEYISEAGVFICPDDPYNGRLLANTQREIPLSYDYHRPDSGQNTGNPVIVECVGEHRCSHRPWDKCRLRLLQDGRIAEAPSHE